MVTNNATFRGRDGMIVELGDTVLDAVTGYKGIVTCIAFYLDTDTRAQVSAPVRKNGKPVEPEWFDAKRLNHLQRDPASL